MATKSQAQPKLFQYAVCPFCWKVKAALALKGISYDAVEVHPLNKKEIAFSKDYRRVPIYIDTKGQQVNDSTAIMRHVDAEFGGPQIFESDQVRKANEESWLAWSDRYVKILPPVIYDSLPNALKAFNYITEVGNFSWVQRRLVKFSGAAVMTMVARKTKKKLNIENPESHLKQYLAEWSEGLLGKPYMGGEKPNAADAAVFGISMSVEGLPAGRLFRENASFFEWMKRMARDTGLDLPSGGA